MKSLALITLALFASGSDTAVTVVPRSAGDLLAKARAQTREALQQKRPDFVACVEKKLPFVAASEQQIDFALDLRDDGAPSLASVTMSTLGNAGVENCLLAVMRTLRFDFGRAQLRISLPVAINMPWRDDAVPSVDIKLTSHGVLSPAQADETIEHADFAHCIGKRAYAVQLKLQVEGSGAVSHAELRADAGAQRDANIDTCLIETARHLRFAERGAGAAVYVPLVFSVTGEARPSTAPSKRPAGCHSLRNN